MPLGAVPALSWCGEVSLGGILIVEAHREADRVGPVNPNTHMHIAPPTTSHSHELHIDLCTSAAFYFRLIFRTSCIADAPRPTRTHPLIYFALYTHRENDRVGPVRRACGEVDPELARQIPNL